MVNAISDAQTPADIGNQLVRLAKAFGFSSVYGGLVPRGRAPRKDIAPLTLVQHVPADWAQRYNGCGYLFRDPVFRRL
ncbi:MAG: autoinducer binding domain-containing protein, partial [Rhodospirillales bacterium]|nr:autoinducer binding domain-containing protein [Acetobacter sp.]